MLKFLILLLFSTNLYAQNDAHITKTFGKEGKCETFEDTKKNRLGIYTLEIVETQIKEETVEATLRLMNLKCMKTLLGFKFVSVSPYQTNAYTGVLGDNMYARTLRVSLSSYAYGTSDILTNTLFTTKRNQVFTLTYDLNDVDFGGNEIALNLDVETLIAYSVEDLYIYDDAVTNSTFKLVIKK